MELMSKRRSKRSNTQLMTADRQRLVSVPPGGNFGNGSKKHVVGVIDGGLSKVWPQV